jgi:hypothetical protein
MMIRPDILRKLSSADASRLGVMVTSRFKRLHPDFAHTLPQSSARL